MRRSQLIGAAFILALAAFVAVGLWQTARPKTSQRIAVVRHPERIMGTVCTLAAVVEGTDTARAEQALDEAEAALRRVEALMSTWLSDSELSRLNAAGVGEEVPLAPDTRSVLHTARDAARETGGAFDTTVRPLISLWRRAGEDGRLPTEAAVADARAASNWDGIELTEAGARKLTPRAAVDLGGIAKGYAIHRAAEILRRADLDGGLVDVGGDLECFGLPPEGERWPVEVKNPFSEGNLAKLRLPSGAVCTSGSYARFTIIGGKRYSHVIDPRTGWPADAVPSVTVVAPEALTADIWATALSVLGTEGLRLLPRGAEALIVLGDESEARAVCTPRFVQLLEEFPPNLELWADRAVGLTGYGRVEPPRVAPTPATPSRQPSS
jgi:thiamine biosynthesis lipoprotein